jgi:hypothetical protein
MAKIKLNGCTIDLSGKSAALPLMQAYSIIFLTAAMLYVNNNYCTGDLTQGIMASSNINTEPNLK